jgi:poly-gamma-glutamate biosynthesis protein PgsC/CapC
MVYETLIIGIVIALLYSEWADLYPGGIIVPAYMALYLDRPLKIVITIAVAFFALLSYRLLSRFFILFGRRRFVLLLLFGAFWAFAWGIVWPHLFGPSTGLKAIGWIIPGLLANNLEKQKKLPTLAGLLTVSVLTYFCARVAALVF